MVLNQIQANTRAGGSLGIPGMYVTVDPGAADPDAKQGTLKIWFGLGWAKSHAFFTGQSPVKKYNRELLMSILHDRAHIADAVNATVVTLDEAPEGYKDFDKGAAKMCVIDPHGMILDGYTHGRADSTVKIGAPAVTKPKGRAGKIVTMKVEDFMYRLQEIMTKEFPGDQVLPRELVAVVQGLVNSIRWAVLDSSDERFGDVPITEPVTQLITTDGFATKWVTRDEILERIEDTSGLPQNMSEQALQGIEEFVRKQLEKGHSVSIEHIGRINSAADGGYVIDLSSELQLWPMAHETWT